MTRVALTFALLMYATVAFASCGHHRCARHWHYRYYDGPRSDYNTRFIGENGGTVHYGN
jgi:hypothetical protein